MRIAIIGRTEILFESIAALANKGHEIALIITSKAAPEYTKTAEDFAALAERMGIPFFATPDILALREEITLLPPIDIAVSLNYAGIIPQSVIDCFRLGILNAHGGDLPRYRGNACQAWAILAGEEKIGLCIHRMIGGELDSGDIVARDYFPLTATTQITNVWEWMGTRIPALFIEAVAQLQADPSFRIVAQPKDPSLALRCYPRRPEDGRIDWRDSAVHILRLINASAKPYAGAFATYNDAPLIVWAAEPVTHGEPFMAIPGQVTHIGNGCVEVATGDGKLRLLAVEYRGETLPPDRLITSLRARLGHG